MKRNRVIYNFDDEIVKKDLFDFVNQPYEFDDFIDVPPLSDDDLSLVIYKKVEAEPLRKLVPSYQFLIILNGEYAGYIDIRIGYNEDLYYGGNIGYFINEKYRGHGYAVRACRLIKYIAKAHKMQRLNITNEYSNQASIRVCEKLKAHYVLSSTTPLDHILRKRGQEVQNIFTIDPSDL